MRFLQIFIYSLGLVYAHSVVALGSQKPLKLTMSDGMKLEARYQSPEHPRGLALILPGTGTTDYDGDISSNLVGFGYHGKPLQPKLSAQMADFLESQGIASLRYTKRVTVDKNKVAHLASFDDMISDAQTAFEWMEKNHPDLQKTIVGFSEGALVGFLVSTKVKVDSLFLLAIPSRGVDELFKYQLIDWPLSIVKKADLNQDGVVSSKELTHIEAYDQQERKLTLPFLGKDLAGVPALTLDTNSDGKLSIADEVQPVYEKFHDGLMKALPSNAPFDLWYKSAKVLPSFSDVASQYKGAVYLYQGTNDSHVPTDWIPQDMVYFSAAKSVSFHPLKGLGHCFAPMDGVNGEIRTSGPFDAKLFDVLKNDLRKEF